MRWGIVAMAALVTLAAWPLFMYSRQELAPVEDQSHISLFFEASPDSSLVATERDSQNVVKALTAFPEADFMWSLTAAWGGFGGMVTKDWQERRRSNEQMYGEVFGAVSQAPGLRVFPRLDPPLPTPGQYDVELVLQSDAPVEQMLETTSAVVAAGWKSGKFLYVDTDLKMDLPEARVVLDRERIADLGLDLASVGRELGTLLGGAYVNRFNFFDRSYKVIPQIGDADRATVGPLLDLKIRTPDGQLVPVSTFTRIETSTAPRVLNRFQQRNAVRIYGGVNPGVTKEEGLRVLEQAVAALARLRQHGRLQEPRQLEHLRRQFGPAIEPRRERGRRRGRLRGWLPWPAWFAPGRVGAKRVSGERCGVSRRAAAAEHRRRSAPEAIEERPRGAPRVVLGTILSASVIAARSTDRRPGGGSIRRPAEAEAPHPGCSGRGGDDRSNPREPSTVSFLASTLGGSGEARQVDRRDDGIQVGELRHRIPAVDDDRVEHVENVETELQRLAAMQANVLCNRQIDGLVGTAAEDVPPRFEAHAAVGRACHGRRVELLVRIIRTA